MRDYRFRIYNPATEMMTYNVGLDRISEYAEEKLVKMQMTGLKDCNDNNIYEGDIVACDSNGVNHLERRVVCYDLFQTRYKAVPLSTYHLNAGRGGWTGYELKYHNEVIGNIYDTPELIKQE